jgi:hypothetical protein
MKRVILVIDGEAREPMPPKDAMKIIASLPDGADYHWYSEAEWEALTKPRAPIMWTRKQRGGA